MLTVIIRYKGKKDNPKKFVEEHFLIFAEE